MTWTAISRNWRGRACTSRYAEVTPELEERLRYELSVIKDMGFSGYFLIVWDFITYAKKQGIIVGPGRGSAAGSLVAYSLGDHHGGPHTLRPSLRALPQSLTTHPSRY